MDLTCFDDANAPVARDVPSQLCCGSIAPVARQRSDAQADRPVEIGRRRSSNANAHYLGSRGSMVTQDREVLPLADAPQLVPLIAWRDMVGLGLPQAVHSASGGRGAWDRTESS